ncbi:hypothetical protein [Lysinibacillus sp. LZ02]
MCLKVKDMLKTAIKLAPVLYPVVKQVLANKKRMGSTPTRRQ